MPPLTSSMPPLLGIEWLGSSVRTDRPVDLCSRGKGCYFEAASQSTTTDTNGVTVETLTVLMKKRLPSDATSYWNAVNVSGAEMLEPKSGTALATSKERCGDTRAFTTAAVMFPSAATKKNSLP